MLQHTFHTLILPLRVEGGQGATEVITASIPLSSPLPDEFMAPSLISFTVSCRFLEDQSVLQAVSFVKERPQRL